MKIFHYHPDTGLFLGEGKADPSPLETGVWLIPAHATTDEPPKPSDSQHIIRVSDAWLVQPIPVPELIPEPDPTFEPMPEPETLTPMQKLERLGLTADDLRAVLGGES